MKKKNLVLIALISSVLLLLLGFQNCTPFGRSALTFLSSAQSDALAKPRRPASQIQRPQVLLLAQPTLSAVQGGSVTLTTQFNAVPMSDNYTVFIHFVNSSGVQQSAMNGDYVPTTPTSLWSGFVSYRRTVVVPSNLPAGKYSIRMGLYNGNVRATLDMGSGVTVDEQTRYLVGSLDVSAASSEPVPQPAPTPTPTPTPTTPTVTPGPAGQDSALYVLSFNDDFNSFNSSIWNDHIWYESSNATKNFTVENGALKIWPQVDATGKFFNRTIDTDGKYYQTYGFFEIEAKLPIGKGCWPAFWLFNHIGDRRPEIDIMEAYTGGPGSYWGTDDFHPNSYTATIWLDANSQGGYGRIYTPDLSAGFHKYGLKWEPGNLTFYFDGKAFYSKAVSMNDPMYLMLDLWFGSASGVPNTTDTPQGKSNSYEINYIRAWKFK